MGLKNFRTERASEKIDTKIFEVLAAFDKK